MIAMMLISRACGVHFATLARPVVSGQNNTLLYVGPKQDAVAEGHRFLMT